MWDLIAFLTSIKHPGNKSDLNNLYNLLFSRFIWTHHV